MYIFFCTVLALSFIIPRAGTKISGIPVTAASVLFGFLLIWWAARMMRQHRLPTTSLENLYVVYLLVAMPLVWLINLRGEWFGAFSLVIPEFVPFAIYFWMFPLTRTLVDQEEKVGQLIKLVLVSTILICLYGLAQKFWGHYNTMMPGITISYTDSLIPNVYATKSNSWGPLLKITSTFQNGNIFGTFLTMVTPIAWAAAFFGRSGSIRAAGLIAAFLVFSIMPFSLSRSVFFGTFLGSGLMMLAVRSWKQRFVITGFLIYSFLLTFFDKFVFTRMILSFFDPSLGGRTAGFQRFVPMLEGKSILFGLGTWEKWGQIPDFWSTASENIYLTLYLWSGLIGLLLFLALVGKALYCLGCTLLSNRYSYGSSLYGYGIGIFISLAAYLIQALIEGAMNMPPTGMNFWFLLGLAVAVVRLINKNTGIRGFRNEHSFFRTVQ